MAFSGGNHNFKFDSSKELISLKEVPMAIAHCPGSTWNKDSHDKLRPVIEAQKCEVRRVQTAGDAGDVVHWTTLPYLKSSSWKISKASHDTTCKTKWVCRLILAQKHFAIAG